MFEVSFLSAKNKPNSWSGFTGHRSDDEDELALKGEIFILLALGTTIKFDLSRVGKLLFDEIKQSYYFASKFTDPLDQIESAVHMMAKQIDQILDRDPELQEAGLDLQAAILVIKNQTVYSSVIGEAKILLERAAEVVAVDEHLADPTGKDFLRVGSFKVDSEVDTIFMLTEEAYESLTNEKIVSVAQKLSLAELKDYDQEKFTIALIADEEKVRKVIEAAEAQAEAESASEVAVEEEASEDAEEEMTEQKEILEEEEILPADEGEPASNIDEEDSVEDSNNVEEEILDTTDVVNESAIANSGLMVKIMNVIKGIDVSKAKSTISSTAKSIATSERLYKIKGKIASAAKTVSQETDGQKTYQVIIARAISAVKSAWNKVARVFRREILGRDSNRAMYLAGKRSPRNWRLIFVVVVILVVLLGIIISNAIENRNQQILRENATGQIKGVSNELGNVETEVTSIIIGLGNEQERSDKIKELEAKITATTAIDISEIRENDDLRNEINDVVANYQSMVDKLRKITLVSNPTLIADLGVNFQNVNSTDLAFHNGNLYVSDSGNDVIYKIPAQPNATPVKFADDDLTGPLTLDVDQSGNLIVIDQDPQNSIGTVSLSDGAVQKHIGGLNVGNVGTPRNFATYRYIQEDRLYWVDTKSKQIKWVSRSPIGGYGSTPNIRKEHNDFSNILDIDVSDGRIYLLSDKTGIIRYFGTNTDPYTLSGLLPDDTVSGMDAFEITSTNIYMADADKRRIVVLSKARNGTDAKFIDVLGQFVNRDSDNKFSNMSEIVFDSQKNQLYILDGLKIYRIDAYEN